MTEDIVPNALLPGARHSAELTAEGNIASGTSYHDGVGQSLSRRYVRR